MVGSTSGHVLWLLKRTSENHRPSHLAAAVVLGVFAGLIPKTSLLCVLVYAVLFVLPLHTLLAIFVSLLVALGANYLDPITHAIGSKLLANGSLRPLFMRLENTAMVPWFQLHNTVVLGNVVIGLVGIAPGYLISLRLFERLVWSPSDGRRRFDQPTKSAIMGETNSIIPPPKMMDAKKLRPVQATPAEGVEERVIFEPLLEVDSGSTPADEQAMHPVRSTPNDWHVHQSSRIAASTVRVESSLPLSFNTSKRSLEAYHFQRAERVDSLDIAHSANEVLAWVDEALEACLMPDDCLMPVSSNSFEAHGSSSTPSTVCEIASTNASTLEHTGQLGNEQWLMETTLEIIRWSEDSMPTVPFMTYDEILLRGEGGANCSNVRHPPSLSPQVTSENMGTASSASLPSPLTGIPEISAVARQSEKANFSLIGRPDQHPHRDVNDLEKRTAPSSESKLVGRSTISMEPLRGESLAYLLGHLRQAKDGRSS